MKFFAIFLCVMVIRYSSAGYVRTRSECNDSSDTFTFDTADCFHKNKTVWDTLEAVAAKEDRVLDSLAKSKTVSTAVLDEYKAAKTLERKAVKEFIFITGHSQDEKDKACWSWRTLLGRYRLLLLCDADLRVRCETDFRTLRVRYEDFFTLPTENMVKYYAMKNKERATFYRYYYRGGTDLYERQKGNEFTGDVIEEDIKNENKVKTESENKVKNESESKMQNESESKMKNESESKMKNEPESKMKNDPESKMKNESESKMKNEPESKMKNEPESKMKNESEYTRWKRDSESQTPNMHAQVFVIFLCMATGIFIVDLQRLEIGEDDLKANKNAMKVKRSFPRTDRIVSAEMRDGYITLDGNRL